MSCPLTSRFKDVDCANTDSELDRPWTRHWPPQPGSPLYHWLQEELPQVLTYEFDPERLFNQPWKAWIRQLIQKECPAIPVPTHDTAPNSEKEREVEPSDSRGQEEREREARVTCIVEKIESLGLRKYRMPKLDYLADHPLLSVRKPFRSVLPFLDKLKNDYVQHQASHDVPVYDVTGFEDHFTLADSGFAFTKVPVDISEWTDECIHQIYLPLMETYLREHFGSSFVHIFSYNFRCEDKTRQPPQPWLSPLTYVHSDFTNASSVTNLKLLLPDRADEILQSRHRYIGIWRPLTAPHQDYPLAVCDYGSVSTSDLIKEDLVFPHYCHESYQFKSSPHHQWFFKRGMGVDDVIVMKLFDSDASESQFCPHSAFLDPTVPAGTPHRASIEIRAIVVG
ncbi:hypothetical protein BDV32DRAFT_150346 [Aspergillus pseudonomiae]|nr:hypothetical protein BDV32DRAFT_150346 [Aspergillus pseudonomiae]